MLVINVGGVGVGIGDMVCCVMLVVSYLAVLRDIGDVGGVGGGGAA